MYMAQPLEPALAQEEVHAEGASTLQYSSVGDLVLPHDVQDATQAAEVEALQAVFLSCIGCSRFTAIQERAENAHLVHPSLVFDVS